MTTKEYYSALEFFHITWEEWAEGGAHCWDKCIAWGESSIVVEIAKYPNVIRLVESFAITVNYGVPELIVTKTTGEWAEATRLSYEYARGDR